MTRAWVLVAVLALAGCSSSTPASPASEYVPTSLEATPCPPSPPAPRAKPCVGTGNPIPDLFAQLRGPC